MTDKRKEFSFATIDDFDKHIDVSVRGYSNLIEDVISFSKFYVENGTAVVDVGCSSGIMLTKMLKENSRFAPHALYTGIEMEKRFHMDRIANPIPEYDKIRWFDDDIRYFDWDSLNQGDKIFPISFITSIFTLQFISSIERQTILKNIYSRLDRNGAFIIAEKTVAPTAKLQEQLTFIYYDYKKKHFSEKEILDKESDLRHMMKPMQRWDLKHLLYNAGFSANNVTPFWQNHSFAAFICTK